MKVLDVFPVDNDSILNTVLYGKCCVITADKTNSALYAPKNTSIIRNNSK